MAGKSRDENSRCDLGTHRMNGTFDCTAMLVSGRVYIYVYTVLTNLVVFCGSSFLGNYTKVPLILKAELASFELFAKPKNTDPHKGIWKSRETNMYRTGKKTWFSCIGLQLSFCWMTLQWFGGHHLAGSQLVFLLVRW